MAFDQDLTTHVLLVPYPTQGHINPLLQFGKRLAARRRGVRSMLATAAPSPGAVHLAAISDGCNRAGYDEAGDACASTWRAWRPPGRTRSPSCCAARRRAAGRCTSWCTTRSSPWARGVARQHGAAFLTQACAVNIAYGHALAGTVKLPVRVAPGVRRQPHPGRHVVRLPPHAPSPATTAWLNAHQARSVVYTAFGSVAKASPVQMAEDTEVLLATGRPFL
uniref:Glycosyltransferase n=1 Tax=Oryza punctata TaxID=4537 RepID=A0A0E0LXI9_ORYPU